MECILPGLHRLNEVQVIREVRLIHNELMPASESGFEEYNECPEHIWVAGVGIFDELKSLPSYRVE